MSDDSRTLDIALHHIGLKIATVILGAVLLGVSSILLCFSTYIFIRRGLKIRSYLFLLVITATMYIVACTYWTIETVTVLQTIYFPSSYAIQSPQSLQHKSLALTVCLGLNIWFSDVVVLWRTLVLWKDQRFVRFICILAFTAITAVFIADVTTTRTELTDYTNDVAHLPIAYRNIYGGIALFVSFGFNIFATCLAAFKAWQYRSSVMRSGASSASITRQSLLLLLECGAFYCILWAAFIAFSAFRSQQQSPAPSYALDQAVVQISAIYPTIIVVLVSLRKVKEGQPLSPRVVSALYDRDRESRLRPLSMRSAYSYTGRAQLTSFSSTARSLPRAPPPTLNIKDGSETSLYNVA